MKASGFRFFWVLAFVLWLGLIIAGYVWLSRYSFSTGRTSSAPHKLPAAFASALNSSRPQLFLALHPRCPCSRATVSELANILTRAPDACDVTVLMFKPAAESNGWMEGPLLEHCRRMKCGVRSDPDGLLAASLGGLTSGSVALYDRAQRLCYQGGITASRGHEGDNRGERAVINILQGRNDSTPAMPVFGCPIQVELTSVHARTNNLDPLYGRKSFQR